jgi:transcriptional regulator with XRE-family HTH domain
MTNICEHFGKNVRRIRREREITQETLAGQADIKRSYLTEMEAGRRNPSIMVASRIAKALNVPMGTLLD